MRFSEACATDAHWFCTAPAGIPSFGFAEQMVIPARAAVRVPDGLAPEHAALTEPIACGVHAVRHSWTGRSGGRIDGSRVVVLGAGMLGLAAVMAARFLGAEEVTIVGRYDYQRDAAVRLGADRALAERSDLEGSLRRARANVVIEAVGGGAATLELAMNVVAKRGEVIVLGAFDRPQAVNAGRALTRETRVFFPVSYARLGGLHDFDIALDLMASGGFPLEHLRLRAFPLSDIASAFESFEDKTDPVTRILVIP